jgi:uncharacterized phage protein (TIGR01671 family)
MRDIKFRAWIKEEQIITYFEDESYILNGDMSVDAFDYDKSDCKYYFEPCYKTVDAEIMQYTGLKDKNEKEIYEGDILKVILPEIEPIIGEIIYVQETCSFIIKNYNGIDCGFFEKLKDIEVIGNIYDNPELLEKGEQS